MANKFHEPGDQRASRANDLFAAIAPRYDLINDLQSFGLHRVWKKRLLRLAAARPGERALDVCCGTGDLALALARSGARVVGLDFNERMLQVAEARRRRPEAKPPAQGSFFRFQSVEVTDKLGADASISEHIARYYQRVNDHNREAFKDLWPSPPEPGQASYVGVEACTKCHASQRKFWNQTSHAAAYATLSSQHKEFNLDCVGCHVTGYGKPGGYPEVGKNWTEEEKLRAPLMEGVGCESCHGPGEKYSPYKKDNKEYKWADLVKLGAIHPEEPNCKSCHNDKSPNYTEFKFSDKIGKDTHEVIKMKADHACDHKHGEGK